MTARQTAEDLVRLLGRISGGAVRATVDGRPFAELDGEHRTLTVEVGSWLEHGPRGRALLRESHVNLWEARGIPGALARSGWSVRFRDGAEEVIRLGRDASALTGHVHVAPAALWKLRRYL